MFTIYNVTLVVLALLLIPLYFVSEYSNRQDRQAFGCLAFPVIILIGTMIIIKVIYLILF